MRLVMLHGTPGAGKLTTARELAKLTGFPVFHNHLTVDLVAAVFEFATPPFQDLREQIWLAVIARAAREQLPGLIFTFGFEPSVLPGFYDRLRAIVEDSGGALLPVELRCETEENLRRLVKPDRDAYLKTKDVAMVRRGIESGEFLPQSELPGNLVIDTTNLPAAQTARLIVERLGLGSA
jgi:hypothetical protein